MKPRIGLVGYFGYGNFGDELFVQAHNKYLSDKFDLKVVHDLLAAPYFSKEKFDELSSYDGFLIGGGDLINASVVSELYWRDEYLKKPVFVYGVGVPAPGRKSSKAINHYKSFFQNENVKLTVLRDEQSCKYFNYVIAPRNRAVFSSDAVCALDMPKARDYGEKTIGFCIREHRTVVGNYDHVREAADYAKKLGFTVKFIVLANGYLGNGDYQRALELSRPDEEVIFTQDLKEMCSTIGGLDLLVSIKFHGMIVASMYGVPSLQLSNTPKNINFLNYIERLELASDYLDPCLYQRIPRNPARLHSLLVKKLKDSSIKGYHLLKTKMSSEFGV